MTHYSIFFISQSSDFNQYFVFNIHHCIALNCSALPDAFSEERYFKVIKLCLTIEIKVEFNTIIENEFKIKIKIKMMGMGIQ